MRRRLPIALVTLAFAGAVAANADVAFRVQDINLVASEPPSLEIEAGVEAGGRYFFAARTAESGWELWASDGTVAGTQIVRDIHPGPGDSHPTGLVGIGGRVFFFAEDGMTQREVWSSDGTREGTWRLSNLPPTPTEGYPSELTTAGGQLYFLAWSASNGIDLWRSDGSVEGTEVATTANWIGELFGAGQRLYFNRIDQPNGLTLWVTDGTPGGASVLMPRRLGLEACELGPELVGVVDDPATGSEVWVSDGTSTGTLLLRDIRPGPESSEAREFTVLGDKAYFVANDGVHGSELWVTDGSPDGTTMVKDIRQGWASSDPDNLEALGSTLVFTAKTAAKGYELWISDGTASGTTMIRDLNPGAADSYPDELISVGDRIVFFADDGVRGREPFSTDGTAAGTRFLGEIAPGPADSVDFTPEIGRQGSRALFLAWDSEYGPSRLWRSNGTVAGTSEIGALVAPRSASNPRQLSPIAPGGLFLSAVDTAHGREPWFAPAGSIRAFRSGDLVPGPEHSVSDDALQFAISLSGAALFAARAPTGESGLWRASESEVMRIGSVTLESGPGSRLGSIPGGALFSSYLSETGAELWFSDGTSSGTRLVEDMHPGPDSSGPRDFTLLGPVSLFTANRLGHLETELWSTDGTSAGTTRIAEGHPGLLDPSHVSKVATDRAVFVAYDESINRRALWSTDGTPTGTLRESSLCAPGECPIGVDGKMVPVGSGVVFPGTSPISGSELWYNGSIEEETWLVEDLRLGVKSSFPSELVSLNGEALFRACRDDSGCELFASSGQSVRRVADLEPGPDSSRPTSLSPAAGQVYFAACTASFGCEPWVTDGSAAGTKRLGDIAPGPGSSNPGLGTGFVARGRWIYFAADDGTGAELWAVPQVLFLDGFETEDLGRWSHWLGVG